MLCKYGCTYVRAESHVAPVWRVHSSVVPWKTKQKQNNKVSLLAIIQTQGCTHCECCHQCSTEGSLFILLIFRKIPLFSGWRDLDPHKTFLTWDNLRMILAPTSSKGPKRKWTSSDALGFCMCFFSLACRGSRDRGTVRRWCGELQQWIREIRGGDISPRGSRPASVSAGYRWTLLQRGAWLVGSACPL